jgi:hypothetical protein
LAAVTARTNDTTLRAGCDPGADTVETLAAGEPVQVKFAYAGEPPCFKVSVEIGGRTVTGYVGHRDLAGLDQFEQERRTAATGSRDSVPMSRATTAQAAEVRTRLTKEVPSNPEVRAALDALDDNEPSRALAVLQLVLKTRSDPGLLALAGIAAWKNDEPRSALDYWKKSLDMRRDTDLERLYKTVERETAGDRSIGRVYGMRVMLRYEPDTVKPDLARGMVLTLDSEMERIKTLLGCTLRERIVAVVQSREAYLATTGAAQWSGGSYDGRIRVALIEDDVVGPKTRRAFAHELVHACLAQIGQFPAWLHEGVAQRLSGDRLSPEQRARLRSLIGGKHVPRLEDLGVDFASADQRTAQDRYALALAAADLLAEHYNEIGIRNILSNPSLFTQVTAELNRKLGLL